MSELTFTVGASIRCQNLLSQLGPWLGSGQTQTFLSGAQKALLAQSSLPLHCCTDTHWPGFVGDTAVPGVKIKNETRGTKTVLTIISYVDTDPRNGELLDPDGGYG